MWKMKTNAYCFLSINYREKFHKILTDRDPQKITRGWPSLEGFISVSRTGIEGGPNMFICTKKGLGWIKLPSLAMGSIPRLWACRGQTCVLITQPVTPFTSPQAAPAPISSETSAPLNTADPAALSLIGCQV